MSILINAFSAKRGGGVTYLSNFFDNIPLKYNKKIFVLKSSDQSFKVSNKQITFINFNKYFSNPIIVLIWEFFFLKTFIKNKKITIYFSPGGIIPFSLKGLSIKKITMFRNMIPFNNDLMKEWPLGYARFRNFALSIILKRSMKNADKVIFISNYGYSVIREIINDIDKKKSIIYHGINKSFFRKKVKILNAPIKKKFINDGFIVYPSIIDVYKSQLEVVQSYKIVKEELNIKIPKLLLIGEEYGEYAKKVNKLIKINKLENDVFLIGPIKHKFMPWIYNKSKFTIFASKSENCPNILLEAMATGSGILCSKLKPMKEFAGNTVEYFDPSCPRSLAKKIIKFLNDEKLIKRYGSEAKLRAQKYNWKDTTIKTLKAID